MQTVQESHQGIVRSASRSPAKAKNKSNRRSTQDRIVSGRAVALDDNNDDDICDDYAHTAVAQEDQVTEDAIASQLMVRAVSSCSVYCDMTRLITVHVS